MGAREHGADFLRFGIAKVFQYAFLAVPYRSYWFWIDDRSSGEGGQARAILRAARGEE